MSEQKMLCFDPPAEPPASIPAHRAPPEDAPRLSGQNEKIFELLKIRPHTNSELAEVSLKYTSRVSDVRKWVMKYMPGWTVNCTRCGGGLSSYSLDPPKDLDLKSVEAKRREWFTEREGK